MCTCVYIFLNLCVCSDREHVREEMGRNGLRKRGRVRMALGIPGRRGKKIQLVFPEQGHIFPISGQLSVVWLSTEGANL